MTYARLSVTTRSVLRELDEQDRVRSERYNEHIAGEAADTLESRTVGRSRFPETTGRLRAHEREVS